MYILLTAHLRNSDPRKFWKDCPSEIQKAIRRLYDPVNGVVPKLYRILQDIKRVLVCLQEIVKAGGAVVPGSVNRNGHRAKNAGPGQGYYGRRENEVIKTMSEIGIFVEVQEVAKEFLALELAKFEEHKECQERRGNQESDVEEDSNDKNSQS
jgi:hypothetical protein